MESDCSGSLIISLAGKFERPSECPERIVCPEYKLEGTLRLYRRIEGYYLVALGIGMRKTQFLKERSLIIKPCGEAQCKPGHTLRHKAHARTRTYEELLVVVPVRKSHAGIDIEETGRAFKPVAVADKCRKTI